MNIFAVSTDSIIAGSILPDKLTVKMVLETAQMLSTAVREFGYEGEDVYKKAHLNHPCSKWARSTQGNYEWLIFHGLALAEEYTRRYGKIHKSQAIIERCSELIDLIPPGDREEFVVCMDEEFKRETPTASYRNYVRNKSYFVGGYKRAGSELL